MTSSPAIPDGAIRVLSLSTVDITQAKLLRGIIEALRDEGYVSEAACADGKYARQLREEGFVVHPLPFKRQVLSPASHLRAFFALLKLLRERQYHVVHAHTPVAMLLGRVAAKVAGVPIIIYTSHGFQFHESRPGWAQWTILQVEKALGRITDMIFTQSSEDAETARREGIAPPEQIEWIGNGIELARFSPEPVDPAVREELDLNPHHRVVGFVGRVVREKGIVELIEAMGAVVKAVPEARLVVVGDTLKSDGDQKAKGLVEAAIERHGLHDVVRFAGLRDDVPRVLRAFDAFVLPSWREGVPRSIIEAMASGLPVVATDIRGCREEVVEGETGHLVPVKNPEALAEAITKVLADLPKSKAMGAKGRELALAEFDEQTVVERQVTTYRRLLREAGLLPEATASA